MQKLLFTGGSGFVGRHVLPLLGNVYDVTTCDRSGTAAASRHIICDLTKGAPDLAADSPYDIVVHAAGKAHTTPADTASAQEFFDVNLGGTVNLCDGLTAAGLPRSLIFISSVSVYGCESGERIAEDHQLNGSTAYALSKIEAENHLTGWCGQNGVKLTILRPTLLLGHNAAGSLGAMVDGIKRGLYLNIDGGKARRSVMPAEDIAHIVPMVADLGGIYNACSSYAPTYAEISRHIAKQLRRPAPLSLPGWLAGPLARVGDHLGLKAKFNTHRQMKMTSTLTFSNAKLRKATGWIPMDPLTNFDV